MQNSNKNNTENKGTGDEFMAKKQKHAFQSDNDALNSYLKELEKPEYDVLDKETERKLIEEYATTGSIEAKNALVMHNARLIPFIIRQYGIFTSDIMDLIQAGNIGLIEAVENFNPNETCRLGTYASFLIKKHILSATTSDLNKVYIPYGMSNKMDKYRQLREKAKRNNIELTDELVMAELGVSKSTLATIKRADSIEYASLSTPIGSDESGKIYLADIIPDDTISDFERELTAEENHNILLIALGHLTPREHDIIISTYGLGCDKRNSRELAVQYGVSMERICQIRKMACQKMRKVFHDNGVYGAI